MLRRLRIAASVFFAIACVALMGMWVRSYSSWDQIRGRISAYYGFAVYTRPGRLALVERGQAWQEWSWELSSGLNRDRMDNDSLSAVIMPLNGLGFAATPFTKDFHSLQFPFWFLVLTSGSLAMVFRAGWPMRFTLRSLFIATTFLAVVLGMIAWVDHSWIGK